MKISFEQKESIKLELTQDELVTILDALGDTNEEAIEGSAELYNKLHDAYIEKINKDLVTFMDKFQSVDFEGGM